MSNAGFFTAIKYGHQDKSFSQTILEHVDNYFYLGGKKAVVIQGKRKDGIENVILTDAKASLLERIGKVALYLTIIIPVGMLIAKAVLRSTHTFCIIPPPPKIDYRKELEKGIHIPESTIQKIQRLMPKICVGKKDDEIEWLSKGNNYVFRLKDNSSHVFKITRENCSRGEIGTTDSRFENMVKAKEVCMTNELGLLVIPHAKKFQIEAEGRQYTFIAEEGLDLNHNESAQEENFHQYSKELNATARQLAVFIAKTGFNDVTWRNIPILNEAQGYKGPRRVGLIDLEHMEDKVNGFIGDGNGSRGLIRCVSAKQIDGVIAEAKKHGVALSDKLVQQLKNLRLSELESDEKLRELYRNRGIVTGKEPIPIDVDSLGLDLNLDEGVQVRLPIEFNEEGGGTKWKMQALTLRKVTEDLIAEINRLIQEKPDQASLKGKRHVVINTNIYPFMQYDKLGLPKGVLFSRSEEEDKLLWPRRIIQALADKGHIFKLDNVNGHGYFVQA